MSPKTSHYLTLGLGIASAIAAYLVKSQSGQVASIAALVGSVLAIVSAQFSSSVLPSVNAAAAKDGAK
jgi:hypothetical protein